MQRNPPSHRGLERLLRQLVAMPRTHQAWLLWLVAATALPIPLFLDTDYGRWIALFQLGNFATGTPLALRHGFVGLLGVSHLIFWTPMLVVPLFTWPEEPSTTLEIWAVTLSATVAISLVFDARDLRAWQRGDRSPIGGAPEESSAFT